MIEDEEETRFTKAANKAERFKIYWPTNNKVITYY